MMYPSPLHDEQGVAMEKNPELLRTCPVPPHVGHTFLPLPDSAPEPPQVPQEELRLKEISTLVPKTASVNGISRLYLRSAPRCTEDCPWRLLPDPPLPPKKELKIPPKSPPKISSKSRKTDEKSCA